MSAGVRPSLVTAGFRALLSCAAVISAPPWLVAQVGVPVAKVDVVGGRVEHSTTRGSWKAVSEGFRLRTGEQLRTGPDALARIDFPFMSIVVGSSSIFSVSPSLVLSTVLESGRVEQFAEGIETIKLRTPEVEVRGGGRVVVRRDGASTRVAVLGGQFRVEAMGRVVNLGRGQGTIVTAGKAPLEAVDLPLPPSDVAPGSDPVYVLKGQPATLTWTSHGSSHHVQILGIGPDEILVDRDVGPAPVPLEIPWLGTFRWRVSSRDHRGLEGLPSKEGVVCVVEK